MQSWLIASHCLSRDVDVDSGLLGGRQHVLAIRSVDVSWRLLVSMSKGWSEGGYEHTGREVVANAVPSTHARVHLARGTVLGSTADLCGADPDDLRIVAPCLEVGEIRVGLTIGTGRVKVELAVVPHFRDGLGDDSLLCQRGGISRCVHGNVLAVTTAARGTVDD